MSATIQRIPRAEAMVIAQQLYDLLAPECSRLEICGSIRRRRQMVGDLDLVAISRTEAVKDPMFGEPTGQVVDLLDVQCDALLEAGMVGQRLDAAGRPRWGVKAKRMTFRGLSVNLNAVEPSALGVWMAIRTGPATLSHRLVTPRSERIFLPDVEFLKRPHGLLPPGFEFPKGSGFQLHRFGGRVETPTEESFFEALGLPWIEPEDRR